MNPELKLVNNSVRMIVVAVQLRGRGSATCDRPAGAKTVVCAGDGGSPPPGR
jgi:hypothetical protein